MQQIKTVLNFWFKELTPEQWFIKDKNLDQKIKDYFGELHQQAGAGELFEWRKTASGALAEVIILDQFSRNIYRDNALSFAFDGMALVLAQNAIDLDFDSELNTVESSFLYMPFMHSESLAIHEQALKLFSKTGLENNLDFEKQHINIIERFGRYPHRNNMLNRSSTEVELQFLTEKGSSF